MDNRLSRNIHLTSHWGPLRETPKEFKKLEKYNEVVKYLGDELYSNRVAIARGDYERKPEAYEVVQPENGLDQSSSVAPYIIETWGADKLGEKVSDYKDESEGCQNCTRIR